VCEQMASAARIHVAEKGRDPRRYALLATGGAAPGHACRVAAKLGLTRVICPPGAGVASTFGLLVAPPKVDLVASYVARLDELDFARLEKLYESMSADAIAQLAAVGVARDDVTFERRADMRYVGQGFEIVVPLPENAFGGTEWGRVGNTRGKVFSDTTQLHATSHALRPRATVVASFREAFERAYLDAYARLIPGAPIETLTWRLTALGPTPRAAFLDGDATTSGDARTALKRERSAWFPEFEEFRPVPVYDRYRLRPGASFVGPAIVEERESTVVVIPGATCRVDAHGSLVIDLGGNAPRETA
jgi:N-methylhydantoinase A